MDPTEQTYEQPSKNLSRTDYKPIKNLLKTYEQTGKNKKGMFNRRSQ